MLSLQTHENREEFWYVISGTGSVRVGNETLDAAPGSTFSIPKKTPHRLSGTTDISILEVSTGVFDDNDIIRLEDKYGRTSSENSSAGIS